MPTTRRTALALFLVVAIAYQVPLVYDLLYKPFFNWAPGIDVASTTLLPLSLLERGDWTLDQFGDFYRQYYRDPYFIATVNGRTVSRFPVAGAVLALPFYGVPLATGWIADSGHTWLPYPWTAFMVAKGAAALIAALAVLAFFFCARELTDAAHSAALALVFAFGTSVWSTASQGMWQQTPSLLLQLLGVWFVLRGRRKGSLAVAPGALFLSAATVVRQNNALPALIFTVYVLIEHRAALWRWIAWAIPPALLAVTYNVAYNGGPLVFGYQEGLTQAMGLPRLDGLAGLLLSPSRGLLIYSPFLLFALFGLEWVGEDGYRRFYRFAALTLAAGLVFLSTFPAWDGGWGYGTRLQTDVLPYAMLLVIPFFVQARGAMRGAFWAMTAYAVVVQSMGLWDNGVRWHWHFENAPYDVWSVTDNEPWFYVQQYAAMARQFAGRYLVH